MILFCETCKEFFTNHRMATESKCDKCEANEYLRTHERRTNEKVSPKKEQETRSVPGKGDGDPNMAALVGQLMLQI